MSMSGSINAEERRLAQQRQQDCLNAAIFAGCKASVTALFVSGGLCGGLIKYSEVGAAAGAAEVSSELCGGACPCVLLCFPGAGCGVLPQPDVMHVGALMWSAA
jgi:hypothetical protein